MPDPDYKALCAELVDWAERTSSHYYKQADVIVRARAALAEPEICNLHREMVAESVARRARTALAQPEPVAPTDEELITMWATTSYIDQPEGGLAFARAVLARWGTPANTTSQEDYE